MGRRRDLPCAVCGQHPEPVETGLPDQPYGTNIFTTTGHYGATAFDSPGGDHLELLVCTPCLHAMAQQQVVHRVLAAAGDTAGQRLVWRSPEDEAAGVTPWDELNLANQRRLEACAAMPGMTPEALQLFWENCQEATGDGKVFDPFPARDTVPSWEGQELPTLHAANLLLNWMQGRKRSLTSGLDEQVTAADRLLTTELARIFEVRNPSTIYVGSLRCTASPVGVCVYDSAWDCWHDNCLVCWRPSRRALYEAAEPHTKG